MNLKDIRIEPDEGIYEKIERRLARRRMWRWSATTAAAVAVAGAALWAAMNLATPATPSATPSAAQTATQTVAEPQPAPATAMQAAAAPAVQDRHAAAPCTPAPQAAATGTEPAVPAHFTRAEQPSAAAPQLASDDVKPNATAIDDLILDGADTHGEAPAVEENPAAQEEQNTAHPAKDNSPTLYENVFTAPNVVIPQGDVDENRYFRLQASSEVSEFRLGIYNRAGRLVFSTKDINERWDCTYNGSPVSQGAYVWMALFRDTDGTPRRERGTVTVIR